MIITCDCTVAAYDWLTDAVPEGYSPGVGKVLLQDSGIFFQGKLRFSAQKNENMRV